MGPDGIKVEASNGGLSSPGQWLHTETRKPVGGLVASQTTLHPGLTATYLTPVWGPSIFGYKTCILTALGPLVCNANNMQVD